MAPMQVLIQEVDPSGCADLQAKGKDQEKAEEIPCPAVSAKGLCLETACPAARKGLAVL